MPYRITEFQTTPNPNALKCVLDRKLASPPQPPPPRSYFNAEQAKGDRLAEALFAISGVRNLLIQAGWITVSKAADSDWKPIKAAVERVLHEAE
jgi:hypothetical protein